MADYAQSLNKDTVNNLFTSSRYGTAESKWVNDIALPAISATLQNAATATGDGADFTIDGYGTVLLEVTGTFVASIAIKGSMDGTNFNTTLAVIKLDTGAKYTTITTPGTYKVISPGGLQKLRCPVTWTSGTSVTVKSRALPLASNDNSFQLSGSKASVSTTMQNAAAATGNGTSLDVSQMATAALDVRITGTATVTFEVSNDGGTTWYQCLAVQRGTGALAFTATSSGIYEVNVAGFKLLRTRISSYTSGTITIYGDISPFPFSSNSVQITGTLYGINEPAANTNVASGATLDVTVDLANFTSYVVVLVVDGGHTCKIDAILLRTNGTSNYVTDSIIASGVNGNKHSAVTQCLSPKTTIRYTNESAAAHDVSILVYGRRA